MHRPPASLPAHSLLFLVMSWWVVVSAGCGDEPVEDELAALEATCALMSSCDLPLGSDWRGMSSCVWTLALVDASDHGSAPTTTAPLFEAAACLAEASSCDEIAPCIEPPAAATKACLDSKDQIVCHDDVIIDCEGTGGGAAVLLDCGEAGMECGTLQGQAVCGIPVPGGTSSYPRCLDDDLLVLDDTGSVLVQYHCPEAYSIACTDFSDPTMCNLIYFDTCGESVLGELSCIGSGGECNVATFDTKCFGGELLSCGFGGLTKTDCSERYPSFVCKEQPGVGAACLPETEECEKVQPEQCDDGVITYCAMGATATFDCKEHGFEGCATEEATVEGGTRTVARCTK